MTQPGRLRRRESNPRKISQVRRLQIHYLPIPYAIEGAASLRSGKVREMRHSRNVVLLAAFALLAVTPSISSASALRSGLHGAVRRGPTQPVCHAGTPCTAPAANVLVRFVRGTVTRQVRTNAVGQYAIQLAPGTYAVRIAASSGYKPGTARVSRGRVSTLNILIDTGIR